MGVRPLTIPKYVVCFIEKYHFQYNLNYNLYSSVIGFLSESRFKVYTMFYCCFWLTGPS